MKQLRVKNKVRRAILAEQLVEATRQLLKEEEFDPTNEFWTALETKCRSVLEGRHACSLSTCYDHVMDHNNEAMRRDHEKWEAAEAEKKKNITKKTN